MTPRRWHPPTPHPNPPVVTITERQADVLAGMCMGLTNVAIGRRLKIVTSTVGTRSHHLFLRMGARDRCHAVALACTEQVHIVVQKGPIR